MADYFCTHCGCRHEPLAHVRHVTAREKLQKLVDWLAEDSDSDGTATAALREDVAVPQDCQARAGTASPDV